MRDTLGHMMSIACISVAKHDVHEAKYLKKIGLNLMLPCKWTRNLVQIVGKGGTKILNTGGKCHTVYFNLYWF